MSVYLILDEDRRIIRSLMPVIAVMIQYAIHAVTLPSCEVGD